MANASRKKAQAKTHQTRKGPPPGYKRLRLSPKEKHDLLRRYSPEERVKELLFIGKHIYRKAG